MDTKHAHIANRSYEDYDPVYNWRTEENRDTVELHLPGFKREHIRIQIDHLGFLIISGERPLDGTRWRRFQKEFELPSNCIVDDIYGNFMQSILSVVMPKKIPQQEEITEFVHKKDLEKKGFAEKTETTAKEALAEDTHINREEQETDHYQFAEKNDVGLTPETTREIALKFMVVIIVLLVIASYVADMSKSIMTQAQSYFNN
ncbi:inactive protein RESTRICTED TEV MOVEMENT 2-like [Gastrolobium bilobum]|uniref:inactive protein RESTRICTED TEV MOVEMENT 2-like n=1 Tax=Gastrolobium bilobum TaxID=150636 RepID=UPI002AB068CE|nr:inactive protein RESTRICTED TEV MOVEMENT 2-like [Gastrolobium bilobum]